MVLLIPKRASSVRGAGEFQLQAIIDDPAYYREIVKKVVNAALNGIG